MTQIFKEDGNVYPVTRVVAGPCYVIRKKTDKTDGYVAIQAGFEDRKSKHTNKALKGLFNKFLKKDTGYKKIKEFRLSDKDSMAEKLESGNKIMVDIFEVGEKVDVKGVSKGKGFQGVVKRHGFSGSPASHGHKDQLRMPGSIGATGPAHVFKGTKMGGHMGVQSVTVTGLEIIKIDADKNELFIRGAVPGARDGYIYITTDGDFEVKKPVSTDASLAESKRASQGGEEEKSELSESSKVSKEDKIVETKSADAKAMADKEEVKSEVPAEAPKQEVQKKEDHSQIEEFKDILRKFEELIC